MLGSILSGAGQVMGAVGSYIGQQQTNKVNQNIANQNLSFQRENLAYQKQLQQQLFEREDNAVQRRRADLLAAGLSPVLAAGGAANAGSVVPVPSLRNEYLQQASPLSVLAPSLSGFAQNFLNSQKTAQEIPNISEQTKYLEKQQHLVNANIGLIQLTGNKMIAEISNLSANTVLLRQSAKYAEMMGVPITADEKTKFAAGMLYVFRSLGGEVDKFSNFISNMIPGIAGDAIKSLSSYVKSLSRSIFGNMSSADGLEYPVFEVTNQGDASYYYESDKDSSGDFYNGYRSSYPGPRSK